jgi:glycosyltransferase involved in cell wall biosynthesis
MGRQTPTVSVLMPVYNGASFLEVSVNSILSQTVGDFELIIVDDGSIDQTPIILSSLAAKDFRIRLLHNSSRQGISATLNQAARLACGPLIARMDADDWAHESRFASQIEAFQRSAGLVVCGSNATHVDEQMRPIFHTGLPLSDWDIRCATLFENPFAHSAVMMQADAFRRIGGYNERYSTTQDYELWTRLMTLGEVRNLEDSLIKLRRHRASVSAQRHNEQSARTAEVQRDYARKWLGIPDWHESRYFNIRQHLYRGPRGSVNSLLSGSSAVRDSVKLSVMVKKHYPNKNSFWLRRYILGRCIFLILRRPVDFAKILSILGLAVCYPVACIQGVIELVRAGLQSRPKT